MADVLHFPAETTHFGTAFVTGLCSMIVQLRRVFIEVLPTAVLDMIIDLLGPVAEQGRAVPFDRQRGSADHCSYGMDPKPWWIRADVAAGRSGRHRSSAVGSHRGPASSRAPAEPNASCPVGPPVRNGAGGHDSFAQGEGVAR